MTRTLIALLLCVTATLHAAERNTAPRLLAQLVVGPASDRTGVGWEPGIAVEWSLPVGSRYLLMRPEVFLNRRHRLGGGATLALDVPARWLPSGHIPALGLRLINHNGPEGQQAELDAIGLYTATVPALGPHYVVQGCGGVGYGESNGGIHGTWFAALSTGYQF